MTRNLKALGPALLAAFAMSAVAASGASATEHPVFTSDGHEVELTAEALTTQVLTMGESQIACDNVSIDNTFVGTEETEITAEPTYLNGPPHTSENCTVLGFPLTVHTNGCHYLFTAVGSMHIQCPEGKQIELTAYILGATRKCLDIPPQTPTEPAVSYVNSGTEKEMDVELISEVEGITYTKTGLCGSTHGNDASYEGAVTITGDDEEGNPVDVTWDE